MRFLLAVLALLLVAGAAEAQDQPNTSGLYLAGHLNGSALSVDKESYESGGGIGLGIGWGVTTLEHNTVLFFLAGDAARMETVGGEYNLAHGDLGIRFLFPRGRWAPFITTSVTGWTAEMVFPTDNITVDVSGTGLTAGGGLNYFVSGPLALTSTVQWTFGRFNKASVNGTTVPMDEFTGRSARVNLGLAWFPTQ